MNNKEYTIEEKEQIFKKTIKEMEDKIEENKLIIWTLKSQLNLLGFEKAIKKEVKHETN